MTDTQKELTTEYFMKLHDEVMNRVKTWVEGPDDSRPITISESSLAEILLELKSLGE